MKAVAKQKLKDSERSRDKDRGSKHKPKERPKLQSIKVSRTLDRAEKEAEKEKEIQDGIDAMDDQWNQIKPVKRGRTKGFKKIELSFDGLQPKSSIIANIGDQENDNEDVVPVVEEKKRKTPLQVETETGERVSDVVDEGTNNLLMKKRDPSISVDNGEFVAKKVVKDVEGMRVDRWVANQYPVITHSLICKWLRMGRVTRSLTIDGERLPLEPNDRIAEDDWMFIPAKAESEQKRADREAPEKFIRLSDEEIKAVKDAVLYKDRDIIIINKPQGLSVQGGTGLRKHLDMMLSHLKFELEDSPKLVHRLDKDTSGILVLARSRKAATAMADKFENKMKRRTTRQDVAKQEKEQRRNKEKVIKTPEEEMREDNSIIKTYWALLASTPNPKEGRIRAPLKKVVENGEERVVATNETGDGSKIAITEYKVIESSLADASFVALWPETGRTHQLRVHCASILGSPIIGDKKYGKGEIAAFQNVLGTKKVPLHLHARRVQFMHPMTNKLIDIAAPLPPTLRESWSVLGFDPETNEKMIEE
eukprot:gene4125-4817_t